MERETIKLDATDQSMGRLASKIAVCLMGKNNPSYQPHIDAGDIVEVENVSKMKFTGKKLQNKVYHHHTGYVGNLKSIKMSELFAKNPQGLLRKCVMGMLPKNRLRSLMIKRLKIKK
ncbi:50S ribosomal protein L13 [bacterium]|nr:50S ribosomal protein L13 [bacterium]